MTTPPGTTPLKVSVITPCFNAERYIAETVASVVNQRAVRSGRVTLEYVVRDGASRDATVARARAAGGDAVTVISEPDRGMYDALAKGLQSVTGDVVAYLNAGDYYHPAAFDVIADVFADPRVHWLTGYAVTYNEASVVTGVALPFRYRRDLIMAGAYDGRRLPFIQQESTFWRRSLQAEVDPATLTSFRLAGDAYLWARFARRAELHIAEAQLGGFRRHPGQLSENIGGYRDELATFATTLTAAQRLQARRDALRWKLPPRLKKRFNPDLLLQYDHATQRWR